MVRLCVDSVGLAFLTPTEKWSGVHSWMIQRHFAQVMLSLFGLVPILLQTSTGWHSRHRAMILEFTTQIKSRKKAWSFRYYIYWQNSNAILVVIPMCVGRATCALSAWQCKTHSKLYKLNDFQKLHVSQNHRNTCAAEGKRLQKPKQPRQVYKHINSTWKQMQTHIG